MFGCGCIPDGGAGGTNIPITEQGQEPTTFPPGGFPTPPPQPLTPPPLPNQIGTEPITSMPDFPSQPSNPTCPTTGTIAISLCVGMSACPAGYFCIYGACCPFIVNRTCSDGSQPIASCMNSTECSDGSTF